jgi:hypothetical protein
MGDINPLSLLPAGVGLVGGIAQSIIGGIKQHKAIKALEKLQTPTYTPNKAINDYYQTALNRYNVNPFQSNEYQYASQQANKALGAGIGALQNSGNALAGTAALVNVTQNNMNKAAINANNQQQQAFGQLANATNMKVGDDRMAFKQNVLAPYEKKANLLNMKAGAGGQMLNAGFQNAFGGLSNASTIMNAEKNGAVNGGLTY